MEAEDDEFGELYYDVLKPFSSLPSPNIKSAEKNPTGEKLETFSTRSADIRCPTNNGGGLQNGEEVVGTVRLEIYLGSRRVLENKFTFSLGGHGQGQVGQAGNDSGFLQSGNLVIDDSRNEMNSVQCLVNHSQRERSEKIVASDAERDTDIVHDSSQCNQSDRPGTVEVRDSNSDPQPDEIYGGRAPGTLQGEINKANKRIDRTSSVEMQEICACSEPCKREPSEEGQLSDYADTDPYREIETIAVTSNSADEARNGYNKVQYPPYKSPLKNTGHIAVTPFGQAVVPHHATTSKPYRHQPKTRFFNMSTLLFDLDMDSLEHKPWRHPSADISDYFNFGLDEVSWKTYCEEIKTSRRYTGKPIQVEYGFRDCRSSVKVVPQRQWDSSSTIQIVGKDKPSAFKQRGHIKTNCLAELGQNGEGSSRSQLGKQNIHQTNFAGMGGEQANETERYNNEECSKRAKLVEEMSRDSSSNMSDNEWMCRHVGMDSWFHPIDFPEQQRNRHRDADGLHYFPLLTTDKQKGTRKGRSKLERWTRHDRDNDDENTSTSSLSSPLGFSNAGVALELED